MQELLSEALEADRVGDLKGLAVELADATIRIADMAGVLGIDLEAVIIAKMAHNKGRGMMHGGKRY